jgi:hypothetical protein
MDLNIEHRQKTNLTVKMFVCHGIKSNLQERRCAGVDRINVARDMGARQTIMNMGARQTIMNMGARQTIMSMGARQTIMNMGVWDTEGFALNHRLSITHIIIY